MRELAARMTSLGMTAPIAVIKGDALMPDPREKALIDASIEIYNNYDPHFAGAAERVVMEARLFLARWDAMQRIGHLPTAQPGCMFVRCPSPTMCKEGCKHTRRGIGVPR